MKLISYYQNESENKNMAWKIFLVFLFISLASAQPNKPCKPHQFYSSKYKGCIEKYTLYTDCTTNDQCESNLCLNDTCVCDNSSM